MPPVSPLMCRLGMDHPVIQGPMAGGPDTPHLVAAVCEAGGLGSIGAAYLTPEQIADSTAAVRARTNRPFAINLFAPTPPAPTQPDTEARARLAPYFAELGLPPPAPPTPAPDFAAQFQAALESGAPIISFTFGLLPPEAMAAARGRGRILIGTATTVVDAICAQGAEAGGHRGTFAGSFAQSMIGTMALVPQAIDAVDVPVIAAGGIMDGRGITAALALGAACVQMGTAFLACPEAGTPPAHQEALLAATEDETIITSAFSGRAARGIANRFMLEMAEAPNLGFPAQNALTRPLRAAAARQGRAEFLALWAGQGLTLARREPAAALMARLARETADAVVRLS
jgi:nitronate monooxygenase